MNLYTRLKAFLTRKLISHPHSHKLGNHFIDQIHQLEDASNRLSDCIVKNREARWRLQAQREQIITVMLASQEGNRSGNDTPERIQAAPLLHHRAELESGLINIDTHLVGLQHQESRLRDSLLRVDNKLKIYHYLTEMRRGCSDPMDTSIRNHQAFQNITLELTQVKTLIQRAETSVSEIQSQADILDAFLRDHVLGPPLEERQQEITAMSRPTMTSSTRSAD